MAYKLPATYDYAFDVYKLPAIYDYPFDVDSIWNLNEPFFSYGKM